jgi:hypothetical protein
LSSRKSTSDSRLRPPRPGSEVHGDRISEDGRRARLAVEILQHEARTPSPGRQCPRRGDDDPAVRTFGVAAHRGALDSAFTMVGRRAECARCVAGEGMAGLVQLSGRAVWTTDASRVRFPPHRKPDGVFRNCRCRPEGAGNRSNGRVAQLAEHATDNREVEGSSPSPSTNNHRDDDLERERGELPCKKMTKFSPLTGPDRCPAWCRIRCGLAGSVRGGSHPGAGAGWQRRGLQLRRPFDGTRFDSGRHLQGQDVVEHGHLSRLVRRHSSGSIDGPAREPLRRPFFPVAQR